MTTREKKLVAFLSSSTLALLVACIVLALRSRDLTINTQAALADPSLRDEIVRRLTQTTIGNFDSHNDPEVGRVLQPHLNESYAHDVLVQTNALGLREKNFELPKPAGTLRVVLLGDSAVQGFGAEAQDRMGVFLQRYLRQHATGWNGTIECLHIGVGGWNAIAECAYLRRILSDLAPDLVFHVLITNDLDDHPGTRGFGGLAAYAPLHYRQTDALVSESFPGQYSSPRNTSYVLQAVDYESRHRYEDMAASIGRLARALEGRGARYVVVSGWGNSSTMLWRFLRHVIEPRQFTVLPDFMHNDPELWVSPFDQHWNRKGHEQLARLLFGVIRYQDLLPELALSPWPEVEEFARTELTNTWQRTVAVQGPEFWHAPYDAVSSLEPARFTELEWRHVYTGLDDRGQVSPFASFFLAFKGQHSLRLRGRALDRPELAGARVQVSVEALPVGEHELVPGEAFDLRFPLPPKIGKRGGVTVRLETDDYGYDGPYKQHCISFLLDQLALE